MFQTSALHLRIAFKSKTSQTGIAPQRRLINFYSTMPEKEQKVLQHILSLPEDRLKQIRGKPQEVLKLIDDFSENVESLMNIGPYKGKLIVDKIKEKKPKIMVELGGYVGYSAILFGSSLPDDPSLHYYSLELNEEFANISRQLIDLAGLLHRVSIIVGKASSSLVEMVDHFEEGNKGYFSFDFIFIDHWKDMYVPDLRVLESLTLISPGTIIVADNIYYPGAPDYVKYIQGLPEERRDHNYTVTNVAAPEFQGRWNILYKSETIPVKNPKSGTEDAIEVTECVEYLNG